jgi:hypothetical protein
LPLAVGPAFRHTLAPLRRRLARIYEVEPDTGRNDTAGDVRVLRVYGTGQDRSGFGNSMG